MSVACLPTATDATHPPVASAAFPSMQVSLQRAHQLRVCRVWQDSQLQLAQEQGGIPEVVLPGLQRRRILLAGNFLAHGLIVHGQGIRGWSQGIQRAFLLVPAVTAGGLCH